MDDNDYVVKVWNDNYEGIFIERRDRPDFRKEVSDALREIGSR